MEELLPYFERELGFLKDAGRAFAARYPALAGELGLDDQAGQDPHIRRLIEANALLCARIARRLDDEFPELTEALLSLLYPHFLRSLPPCAIVQCIGGDGQGAAVLPPGAGMVTQGLPVCRFRSTAPAVLAPLSVTEARYDPLCAAPPGLRLPAGASGCLHLRLGAAPGGRALRSLGLATLPLFVDASASLCAALIDTLFVHGVQAYVEHNGRWQHLPAIPLRLGGFAPDEALLPANPRENPAFRLLTEYFGFPEKFHFLHLDLDLLCRHLDAAASTLHVHVVTAGLAPDDAPARTLGALQAAHLRCGCVPVINLFPQSALPVRIDHTTALYDVVPGGADGEGAEVYSVDTVRLIRTSDGSHAHLACRPYYALRHGEGMAAADRFWFTQRDPAPAGEAGASALRIGFVDAGFSPSTDDGCVASIDTTCSNGARACALPVGRPGGDLRTEGAALALSARLLRKPTAPQRFAGGRALHWRLIAQLGLNHRSLASADTLREALALYDISGAAHAQRQLAGIVAVDSAPGTVWLRQGRDAALVHGTEIRMTLDEAAFAGSSLVVFAQVVNHFYGLYAHLNSFTQLTVLSAQTGKELLQCPPRNGSLALV